MTKELLPVADAAIKIVEEFYPHERQKSYRYHYETVMALKSLRSELKQGEIDRETFSSRMFRIFSRLRDNHTRYRVNKSFNAGKKTETMGPFRIPCSIEKVYSRGKAEYVVSHIDPESSVPLEAGFEVGARVTHWNDVPIEEAVQMNASNYWGATEEAFLAQGLRYLTLRPTDLSRPPAEDKVRIRYKSSGSSKVREHIFRWKSAADEVTESPLIGPPDAPDMGLDEVAFGSQQVQKQHRRELDYSQFDHIKDRDNYLIADYLHKKGRLTYVRIWNFNTHDPNGFARSFTDDLADRPKNGLILDIRGNPGGAIKAAELLLQLLTPKQITPTRFQFANTDSIRNLISSTKTLKDWRHDPVDLLSESHTLARPLYGAEKINNIGQIFYGPVVLIIDALTYSAADMFAASFQDHKIGKIIGVDHRTGGGGSNVWSWHQFRVYEPDYRITTTHAEGKDLRSLIGKPNRQTTREYREWLLKKVKEEVDATATRVIGPLRFDSYLTWIVMGENRKALARALFVPNLFDTVQLNLKENDLPRGIRIPFSIRRCLRQGDNAGQILEDSGVKADKIHQLTRRDVTEFNQDLLSRAANELPTRRRGYAAHKLLFGYTNSQGKCSVLIRGLDTVVVYEDGVPTGLFSELKSELRVRRLSIDKNSREIEFIGYRGDKIIASRRQRISSLKRTKLEGRR